MLVPSWWSRSLIDKAGRAKGESADLRLMSKAPEVLIRVSEKSFSNMDECDAFYPNMTVWVSPRSIGIGLLVNVVVLKLIAIFIVAFWIALQYNSLVASMCDPLTYGVSPLP